MKRRQFISLSALTGIVAGTTSSLAANSPVENIKPEKGTNKEKALGPYALIQLQLDQPL